MVAGGFSAGYIQSGSLKGGLYGAFSSALFFGVGSSFGAIEAAQGGTLTSAQALGRVVTHGIVGGVMSDLQGGKFGHGFVSAGSTQALGPAIDRLDYLSQRVVASAILGGTVSSVTGGKFANGAVTAAFGYAFASAASRGLMTGSGDGPASGANDFDVTLSQSYGSPDAAAIGFGADYGPGGIRDEIEYNTAIVKTTGPDGYGPPAYSYTSPLV